MPSSSARYDARPNRCRSTSSCDWRAWLQALVTRETIKPAESRASSSSHDSVRTINDILSRQATWLDRNEVIREFGEPRVACRSLAPVVTAPQSSRASSIDQALRDGEARRCAQRSPPQDQPAQATLPLSSVSEYPVAPPALFRRLTCRTTTTSTATRRVGWPRRRTRARLPSWILAMGARWTRRVPRASTSGLANSLALAARVRYCTRRAPRRLEWRKKPSESFSPTVRSSTAFATRVRTG